MMTEAARQMIAMLDIRWHEFFEERAAILEFDFGMDTDDAEQAAWVETQAAMIRAKRNG